MKKSWSRRALAAPPPARSRKALWIAAAAVLTVGLAIRFWPTATIPPHSHCERGPCRPAGLPRVDGLGAARLRAHGREQCARARPGTSRHGVDPRRRVLDGRTGLRRTPTIRSGCWPRATRVPSTAYHVDGFWMDKTEVTNDQFAAFVNATGYVTIAEKTPRAEDFPGAPPENLVAGSVVFSPPDHAVPLNNHLQWWSYVKGANWRHPLGPGSSIEGKGKLPVVHVAYDDALAYAKWSGGRLPTEAEWEFAARGGLTGAVFPWGSDFRKEGAFMANSHQGHFPDRDTRRGSLPRRRAGRAVPAQWIRPLRRGRQRLGVGDRLLSPGLLRTARGCGWGGPQPSGARSILRPGRARHRQAGASRRVVPLHRPVLLALHGGDARQGRG